MRTCSRCKQPTDVFAFYIDTENLDITVQKEKFTELLGGTSAGICWGCAAALIVMQEKKEQWIIGKEFALDYGHRVWTQKLIKSHSIETGTACRHLHGHRGTCIVFLYDNELNEQGMVTDFKHLNWFKKFLDDKVDHKFILDKNDPLLPVLLPHFNKAHFGEEDKHEWGFWDVLLEEAPYRVGKMNAVPNDVLKELYDGFVVVDFVPTSENIAKWLNMIVTLKMAEINVKVHSVQWYETPKSQTIYKVM